VTVDPASVLVPGAAASVGSLPYRDAAEAAEAILTLTPELAAAPQLPQRSAYEGMLAQVARGMPGVTVEEDGTVTVGRRFGAVERGAPLDVDAWGGTLAFLDACGARQRTAPIKLQVTGPITFGLALLAGGASRPQKAFAAAAATVDARIRSLVDLARHRAPRAPVVLVLDEPWLIATDATDFPLPLEQTIDLLSSALATATSAGASVTGIHCCGPADWTLVLHAGPDLVSMPAGPQLLQDAASLAVFLERGGWIAWGVVPTDRPLGTRADHYWRSLNEVWADLARAGCDPVAIRTSALITPTCGLAFHRPEQVPEVMGLVRAVADRVHDQAIAVRMSAGA
jgi:hypothetical protein